MPHDEVAETAKTAGLTGLLALDGSKDKKPSKKGRKDKKAPKADPKTKGEKPKSLKVFCPKIRWRGVEDGRPKLFHVSAAMISPDPHARLREMLRKYTHARRSLRYQDSAGDYPIITS